MTNPTTIETGWMGDRSRGAAMGRPSGVTHVSELQPRSVYLSRVKLDSGGYDEGGAYWGTGEPLYCAYTEDYEYCEYERAYSREDAAYRLGLTSEHLKKPLGASIPVDVAHVLAARIYTVKFAEG